MRRSDCSVIQSQQLWARFNEPTSENVWMQTSAYLSRFVRLFDYIQHICFIIILLIYILRTISCEEVLVFIIEARIEDDIRVHIAVYPYMYRMALAFSRLLALWNWNFVPMPRQPKTVNFLRMFHPHTAVCLSQTVAIYPILVKIDPIHLKIVEVGIGVAGAKFVHPCAIHTVMRKRLRPTKQCIVSLLCHFKWSVQNMLLWGCHILEILYRQLLYAASLMEWERLTEETHGLLLQQMAN